MQIPRRPSRFLFYFIFCLFVCLFFSLSFFTNNKSIRGEELENNFFFPPWTHSSWRFFFLNDFHWKCMNINGSKKFQLLTRANRILFFLVLQFVKGICSFFFFFISFFPLFHSMDQHVSEGYRVTRNLIHEGFSMLLLYFAGARTTSNLIDRYFDETSKEWYRFYITFKRHVSSILESKFNLYSLNFSILLSNTHFPSLKSLKSKIFWRELFLFLHLLQTY